MTISCRNTCLERTPAANPVDHPIRALLVYLLRT
jgi:hypothetical protein